MGLTCQNCGSTDVVTIQGQHFCINCGKPVQPGDTASIPAPVTVSASKATAALTVKPKITNHPKTAAGLAVASMTIDSNSPKPKRQVHGIKKSRGHRPMVTATVKSPAPKPWTKLAPKTGRGRVAVPITRSATMGPMRRPATSADIYRRAAAPDSASPSARQPRQHESSHEDIRPHPLSFTLKIGAAVAVPVSAVLALGLWLRLDSDLMLYLVCTSIVLVLSMIVMAQSAILYGLTRSEDGRPTSRSQWWRAARNGFIEVLNVDLMTTITVLVLAIASIGVWQVSLMLSSAPEAARISVLALGNALLVWMLLGALAARHIAVPAVVIGGLTATKSLRLGWQTYSVAGGHMVLALAESLVLRLGVATAIAVGAVTLSRASGSWSHGLLATVIGGIILISLLAIYTLTLQIEARVWLRQYRLWIRLYHPNARLQLLSGRVQPFSNRVNSTSNY